MYKITIKRTVGDLVKETIIETDNLELAKEILVSEEIIKVETDVPNESIDPGMTTLRDLWQKQVQDIWKNPQPPYQTGDWPFGTPFTVTC